MSFPEERNWKSEQNATQTTPILNNCSFMQISMYVQGSFTVSKQLVWRRFLIKLYSHKTGPKSNKKARWLHAELCFSLYCQISGAFVAVPKRYN